MNKEEFDNLGTDIEFIPFGNNPEDEVTGVAFTFNQWKRIRNQLFKEK